MEALKKTVWQNGQGMGLVMQLMAEFNSCPDSSVDIVFSIEVISTPGHAYTILNCTSAQKRSCPAVWDK